MDDAPDIVGRLERDLMSLGVYVEDYAIEETDDGQLLHIEYETAGQGLLQGDIGNVCTELVESYEAGWEPRDCHFWSFNTEGWFHGEWEARAGWFRALDRGDISQTDFSTLVLSTRQPAEEPPAPVPAGFAPVLETRSESESDSESDSDSESSSPTR